MKNTIGLKPINKGILQLAGREEGIYRRSIRDDLQYQIDYAISKGIIEEEIHIILTEKGRQLLDKN